jgi:hypothetical protein
VEFRVREVSFQEADRRYAELTLEHDEGSISDEEFDAQRRQLMVRDDEGRRWAKIGKSGEWHYRDGGAWVLDTPPGYREATPKPRPDGLPSQPPSSLPPDDVQNGDDGRRKVPPWIPVAGLGGIALVGIVLVFWVLVPYLRGEPAPSEQGETMSVKQSETKSVELGESAPSSRQGEEPAPAVGPAFEAVFVHRATPENLSQNSTYLDNPLANGDPNVVLYVTQNWNPGGVGGTYNGHPVGVWYDPSLQRWAIFNQDFEAMPEGAAFNVAVLGAG